MYVYVMSPKLTKVNMSGLNNEDGPNSVKCHMGPVNLGTHLPDQAKN